MRKIALVDFDDTLFDIKRFKKAYFDFLGIGFSVDLVALTYEQAKKIGYFDADKHCELLGYVVVSPFVSGVSIGVRSWLEEWFEQEQKMLQSLVFPDVELFLKTLIHNGYEIHILTLGTEWFQKAKIENSGISQYISGIIVTQDPKKVSAIPSICNPEEDSVWLFDDFGEVITNTKEAFPKITAVQVLRRDEYMDKQSPCADAIARNLGEATGAFLARPR